MKADGICRYLLAALIIMFAGFFEASSLTYDQEASASVTLISSGGSEQVAGLYRKSDNLKGVTLTISGQVFVDMDVGYRLIAA